MAPFGKVIPVVGMNNGFAGQFSRTGERVIAAREVLATTPTPLYFGDSAVIVPDATGGTYQSVRDFITANGAAAMTAALFAGVANREVKTLPGFPYTPGQDIVGSYLPGEIGEVGERGSVTVPINVGGSSIQTQSPVYLRVALNGTFPAGVVGGFEGVPDGAFTAAANAGNTGNGTINTPSVQANSSAGAYSVVFTDATHFNVLDPNGNLIGKGTTGVAFTSTGVGFTITAGGTPFAKGDGFTLTAAMNTINLASRGVVWRTGVVDANGAAELTMKERVAA